MGNGMWERDCRKRDAGRGLWEKGGGEETGERDEDGTVGKGGWVGRRLWEKGGEETVGKGQGGNCGKREGKRLWEKG